LTQLLQEAPAADGGSAGEEQPKPLRVLHVLSRPRTHDGEPPAAYAFDATCEALVTEGALWHEPFTSGTLALLEARLRSCDRPVHAIHFDGPVDIIDGGSYLVLTDSTGEEVPVPTAVLARAAAQVGIAVLSVDAREYRSSSSPITASEGLLRVAREATSVGLASVVGLCEIADPWISAACFREIYRGCVRGLTLGQALIETRKKMQSSAQSSQFTARDVAFHAWPLPVHYGAQDVAFFSQPHGIVEAHTSQVAVEIARRLFGFSARMLPPALTSGADGVLFEVAARIASDFASGAAAAVSVTGDDGSGRTRFAHRLCWHLAQADAIRHAFYFDYARDFFTADDILKMVTPIAAVADSGSDCGRCIFVLDGILDVHRDGEPASPEQLRELEHFLGQLLARGHAILATGSEPVPSGSITFRNWRLAPLSSAERMMVSARVLREHRLDSVESDCAWRDLLASLGGNPWLIEKTLPLLQERSVAELAAELAIKLRRDEPDHVIERYFAWRWNELPSHSQQLYRLCSALDSVYLELLSIAIDRQSGFQPARDLMAELGQESARFADVLDGWERNGLVIRSGYGRILDPRALRFAQHLHARADDALETSFNLCLCEGIRLAAQSALREPGSPIAHHLLEKRGRWVRPLERAWFCGGRMTFAATLEPLEQLMRQAKLDRELALWLLDVLGRAAAARPDDAAGQEQLAWLSVAAMAAPADDAVSPALAAAALEWWEWLKSTNRLDESRIPSLIRAAHFLETYFQKRADWARCASVCELVYPVLKRHQAWYAAVRSLQSLARHRLKLGESEAAERAETMLLEEIPYDGSPPGVREQILLGVLLARVARGIKDRSLLADLRAVDAEQGRLKGVLDRVEAEMGDDGDVRSESRCTDRVRQAVGQRSCAQAEHGSVGSRVE
ncbi:MAG: hypothetical protein ACREUG_04145, partial [Steroidobacteraceae bacterium]